MSAPHPGLFDASKAEKVIRVIQNLRHTEDRWHGQPIVLDDWQRGLITELYGRCDPDAPTLRAYRSGIWGISRRNGKSTIASCLAFYHLGFDGVIGGQVYTIASTRDQAAVTHRMMSRMIAQDDELSARFEVIDYRLEIIDTETNSVYRALAANADALHGLSANFCLVEEGHVVDVETYGVMRTASGSREQPLILTVTTAGEDKHKGIGWTLWDYGRKVEAGIITDPRFFSRIYAADPDVATDDRWLDESVWHEANPALGTHKSLDDMRQMAHEAKSQPEMKALFCQLHLGIWRSDTSAAWIPHHRWQVCQTYDPAELDGLPTYAGVDLGLSNDLSAFVGVTPLPDGRVAVRSHVWMPRGAMQHNPHRPYATWVDRGELVITDGDTSDFARIEADIIKACEEWGVVQIAYDRRLAEPTRQRCEQESDVPWIDQVQGYGLTVGATSWRDAVLDGRLCHNDNDILGWMMSNVITETAPDGAIRISRKKSTGKIDGVIAGVMGMQRLTLETSTPAPPPKKRRLFAL